MYKLYKTNKIKKLSLEYYLSRLGQARLRLCVFTTGFDFKKKKITARNNIKSKTGIHRKYYHFFLLFFYRLESTCILVEDIVKQGTKL